MRSNPPAGQPWFQAQVPRGPVVPSLVPVYPGADFQERANHDNGIHLQATPTQAHPDVGGSPGHRYAKIGRKHTSKKMANHSKPLAGESYRAEDKILL
jgi:hypothetical protein